MIHHFIDQETLRTSRSGAPIIEFQTHEGDNPIVRLTFTSSKLINGTPSHNAVLTFTNVLDFHWIDFDLGLLPEKQHISDFVLQEIEESELIKTMARRDRNLHPPSKTTGIDWENAVHHYRIVFDDHGAYDIVCLKVTVELTPL